MQQEYEFYEDVVALLESFFVRVVVFSISFSRYSSHNDGFSIADPWTLKPSTI